MEARTDWLKVGRDHNGLEVQKKALLAAVGAMEWRRLPVEMGLMPGLLVKAAASRLRLTPAAVAESTALSPFGLVGIRFRRIGGWAEVYVVDEGVQAVPVLSTFSPDAAG